MSNLAEKTMDISDNTLIEDVFRKRFSAFNHPFEHADKRIAKMKEGERKMYYIRALDLLQNEVFQNELVEWKRKIYNDLALTSMNDLERQGYRMALIAIQDFEKRINLLASLHTKSTSIQNLSDKL